MMTGIYAGLLGFVFLFLSLKVSGLRAKNKDSIGTSKPELLEAVRKHGNFCEWVPITILLMAIYEMNLGNHLAIHVFGVSLVMARILHPLGVKFNVMPHPLRAIGAGINILLILILSILVVYQGVIKLY